MVLEEKMTIDDEVITSGQSFISLALKLVILLTMLCILVHLSNKSFHLILHFQKTLHHINFVVTNLGVNLLSLIQINAQRKISLLKHKYFT